jgi:glyoxylase-like metal-dependent hydrolase (beta-lactamase superfamily II)
MNHLSETEPPRGQPTEVAPGVRRIVAGNPGPMTYHGTNTFLVDEADGIVVIDPGPADRAHLEAVLAATGGRVARILLTHSHADHLGNLADLRAATGAPVWARAPEARPDVAPEDGARIGGLTAIHTPGHAPDHLCFAGADGVLFTGDHVMGWSTTVVAPPPRGDMAAYVANLERLLARDDRLYLPAHGPAIPAPQAYLASLIERRHDRERAILRALTRGPSESGEIAGRMYAAVPPGLRRAAELNVRAHLWKLAAEGLVVETDGIWALAP